MKPGRQRLLIPGLLVALLVVVAVAAGIRRAEAQPTPFPVVPTTLVSVLDDPRITESSGLAASIVHPGLAYTVNDSGDGARIFAVDIASGRVVGVTTVENGSWRDAEALALSAGKLWVADVGNNSLARDDTALFAFDEPGRGNHHVDAERYPVTFEPGPVNVEAMAIIPGRIDLYGKTWPAGYAYALPTDRLSTDRANVARRTDRIIEAAITDATASPQGEFILLRSVATVEVRDAQTWTAVDVDVVPTLQQGESITMEADGRSYLLGSEGSSSPLVRVAFDPATFTARGPRVNPVGPVRTGEPAPKAVWWERARTIAPVAAGTLAALVVGGAGWVVAGRRRRRSRAS